MASSFDEFFYATYFSKNEEVVETTSVVNDLFYNKKSVNMRKHLLVNKAF